MKTERMTPIAIRAIRTGLWCFLFAGSLACLAETPHGSAIPLAPSCHGELSSHRSACGQPEAPVEAPDAEAAEPEPAATPSGTSPVEPVICACLSIEDIDHLDAIVIRWHGVRANA